MRKLLTIGTAALLLAAGAVTAQAVPIIDNGPVASSSGPVILIGIDGEDGGVGGHGPADNYVAMVDAMLGGDEGGVLDGIDGSHGDGLLVIGGGKSYSDNVTTMWNYVAAHADASASDGTAGEAVAFVNGAEAIRTRSFDDFEIIVVASSVYETYSGGLTNDENNALIERADDFAAHINGGGGVLGLTQIGLTDRWSYLGNFSQVEATVRDYSNIDPTDEGRALGVDDKLDVCCWHEVYTAYPDFLVPLAFMAGTTQVAALGGESVRISSEDCDDLADNDGDMLIDASDPDCQAFLSSDSLYSGLGDSYSSGEGNPDFEDGSSVHVGFFSLQPDIALNECHRAPTAYPRQVANQLFNGNMIFRACSGAVMPDIIDRSQYYTEAGPQKNFVGPAVDVVTLSIGGNDLGFAEILTECVAGADQCTQHKEDYHRRLAVQKPLLVETYKILKDKALGMARIVIVGYPNIFPDPDIVSGVDDCGDLDAPFYIGRKLDGQESKMLIGLGASLETVLRLAANEAQVEFVPMANAFAGHELCTSAPWSNPAPGKLQMLSHERNYPFHPNVAGHTAMATRVVNHLR